MKKILLISILVAATLNSHSQTQNYSCIRNVSTNPQNPFNPEWEQMIIQLNRPNDPGSFVNTWFNWYWQGTQIFINKNTHGWDLPSGYPNNYGMYWPYSAANGSTLSYLYDVPGDENERDFHWEDGWELLWLHIGTLPNGASTVDKPAGSWDMADEQPNPGSAPYFVLYNRYRGTLRIFFNVWWFEDMYDDVNVTLKFTANSKDNQQLSGVLRHAKSIDKPLDQPTEVTQVMSPRKNNNTGNATWYAADFQMAYDPCQCMFKTKFDLEFRWVSSLDVDLQLRSITLEKDLTKLNAMDKAFLQMAPDDKNNLNESSPIIFKSIDDVLQSYDKALDLYKDELKDYNSQINLLKKDIIGLVGTIGGGVLPTITSSTSALTALIKKTQLPIWDSTIVGDDEAKEYAKEIVKSGKKLMADQFDFLNVVLNVKKDKPIRPQVPVASFTEGKIVGKITDVNEKISPNLFLPGTMPTAYSGTVKDIFHYNFPAYNNIMGQFALLRTPKLQVYDKPVDLSQIIEYMVDFPIEYPQIEHPEEYPVTTKEVSLRLTDGLHFALNPALDWDMPKTSILYAFQIEFDMGLMPLEYIETLKTEISKIGGGNFELTHRLTEPNGRTTAIVTSNYYNVNEAKNLVFSLLMVNTFYSDDDPIPPVTVQYMLLQNAPSISKIKLKVVADMWFQQLGYDDEQVNTFQVFTYELFNKNTHSSLEDAISSVGGTIEDNSDWVLYQPGTIKLSGLISPNDDIVTEQIGNELYVRAEHIDVIGEVGATGNYTLILEAYSSVNIKPGGKLLPSAKAVIRDFYNQGENPVTITDTEFLSSFCTSDYKANGLSGKAQARFEEEQRILRERAEKAKMAVTIYPNPTTNYVQVSVKNQPQGVANLQFALFDITGRQVVQTEQEANSQGQYTLQLPQLSGGIYMLHIKAGQQTTVEKVVIK